jgi:hypothetical protein
MTTPSCHDRLISFPRALSSRRIAAPENGGATPRQKKIIDHQRKVPKLNFLFFSFGSSSTGCNRPVTRANRFPSPTHTQSRTQVILQDRKKTSDRRGCAFSIRTGYSCHRSYSSASASERKKNFTQKMSEGFWKFNGSIC